MKLYELMGLEYFNLGEVTKAQYYHLRSIENQLEADDSSSKINSAHFLKKFYSEQESNCNRYNEVNETLLKKLGIVYDPGYDWILRR